MRIIRKAPPRVLLRQHDWPTVLVPWQGSVRDTLRVWWSEARDYRNFGVHIEMGSVPEEAVPLVMESHRAAIVKTMKSLCEFSREWGGPDLCPAGDVHAPSSPVRMPEDFTVGKLESVKFILSDVPPRRPSWWRRLKTSLRKVWT